MATIYTRATKGSALTWTEGDANIVNLNNDKLEAGPAANAATMGFTTTATAAGVTTLTNTSSVYQLFTGTTTHTVRLPSTDTLAPGWSFHIVNNSTGNVLIQTATPNSLVPVIPGTTVIATCISTDNNTTASWDTGYTDFSTVTGTGAVVLNTGPIITGGSINNTAVGGATATTGRFTILTTTNNTASIVSEGNGNISIQPNGTGQTVVKNLEYQEFVHSLGTTSGTITPDAANGNVQTITLNGNLTLNAFTTPIAGQSLTLIIDTNGTGRTLTSTMLFAGGSKTLSTTDTIDVISVFYDGTNYLASLVKGYA